MADPSRHHIEDVGRILLHAQRELSQIRAGLSIDGIASDPLAAKQAMSDALSKAESNLRLKAEAVLSTSVGHAVASLPTLKEYNFRSSSAGDGATRSLIDVGRVRPPPRPRSAERRGARAALPAPTVKAELAARVAQRALDDPGSSLARRVLAEQYGVAPPRPAVRRGDAARPPPGRLVRDKTTKPAGVLEREARTNPQAPPAQIRPEDVSKGLLSLINRGLLPGHVDLTPALARAPAPAMQAPSRIHPAEERHDKHSGPAYTSPYGYSAANLKLDLLTGVGESLHARQEREAAEEAAALARGELAATHAAVVTPDDALAPSGGESVVVDRARGFDELMDTFSLHHFIIRRGELLDETPEFVSYHRKYAQQWGPLSSTIAQLRALLAEYAVPLAYVDGKKLAELALDALAARTERELLACLVNAEQVESHMRRPGARYAGGERAAAGRRAATAIQAEWRRMRVARDYARLRARHAASMTIAHWWRCFRERTATRALLADRRAREQAAWEAMSARFWKEWPRIRRSRRVIVHVPSLSYSERQRRTLANMDVRQNAQMARLCDVRDPDVEVIYVCPFPLNDDTVSYFVKVLEIGGAAQPARRFRVVVPENYHRFPAHFSLSTLLLYSPRAMRRIANFCRAKDAYIVPNVVGPDELRLSMRLGVPLFSAEPRVSAIYSSKSGSKRIFQAAQVNVPPGAHDLYDEDDLIGSLAHLVAHNLDVPKWVFKVDDEFGGRGNAHFLTNRLPCYPALLAQYDNDPHVWAEESVQAAVQDRIATELEQLLPTEAVIGSTWLFRTWAEFVAAYTRSGGVIEASPLEVRSTPSVSLLIEPDGSVQLQCTHEQLLRDYSYVGAAFPQTAVPHPALRDAALAIGRACYAKSIIGYVGVDLIAFVDEQRLLRVWAVDLNLRLTQSAVMFSFFDFLIGGEYDGKSGMYYAPPKRALVDTQTVAAEPAPRLESERRSYVMSEMFYHPDFAHVHHSAFFNMCRLKGISFDLQMKSGTIFNLLDSFASCVIGVLAVGRTQLDALKTFTDCLDFVQRDIGMVAEIEPEPNGYCEVGLKDIVAALKGLVDRSKKHTRPTTNSKESRSAISTAGAAGGSERDSNAGRQAKTPATPAARSLRGSEEEG
ncbi:hypothetical protein KFE25_008839 [Diacronema lutheri]|uniref:IQCH-like ATP-grasp domain-containing protein n=1 Tax=Diacronema lutheri TaxID=2081491 RepID=A0A8J5XLU0_DIALT|nr:hypothetical protein KFE25_008839 [Diacronema lutheri]